MRGQVTGWPNRAVEGQIHSRLTPGSLRPVALASGRSSGTSRTMSLIDGSTFGGVAAGPTWAAALAGGSSGRTAVAFPSLRGGRAGGCTGSGSVGGGDDRGPLGAGRGLGGFC